MSDKKTVADFVQALKENDTNEAVSIIESIMADKKQEAVDQIRAEVFEEAGFVVEKKYDKKEEMDEEEDEKDSDSDDDDDKEKDDDAEDMDDDEDEKEEG